MNHSESWLVSGLVLPTLVTMNHPLISHQSQFFTTIHHHPVGIHSSQLVFLDLPISEFVTIHHHSSSIIHWWVFGIAWLSFTSCTRTVALVGRTFVLCVSRRVLGDPETR